MIYIKGNAAPAAPAFVGGSFKHSAIQGVPNSTETSLAFDTVNYDSDGFQNPANNTQFVVPTGLDGKYLLTAEINWSANNGAGQRSLLIRKNGTIIFGNEIPGSTLVAPTHGATHVMSLAAGDVLDVRAFQTSGVGLNISNVFGPYFTLTRLG